MFRNLIRQMLVINAEFLHQFFGMPPFPSSQCRVRMIRTDYGNIFYVGAPEVILDLPERHLLPRYPLTEDEFIEEAVLREVLMEENLWQGSLDHTSFTAIQRLRCCDEERYQRLREHRQGHIQWWMKEFPDRDYPYIGEEKTILSFNDSLQHLTVRAFNCTNVRLILPSGLDNVAIENFESETQIRERLCEAQSE